MEDHQRLLRKFGKEKEFSTDEAMEFLGLDPKKERDCNIFARGPRTLARVYAEEDMQGYYLACPYNDKNRLIFTRDPNLIWLQFAKDRRNRLGQARTLVVLARIAQDVGADDFINFDFWITTYHQSRAHEKKQVELEERERRIAAREKQLKLAA
jgi:hypothetical protein